MQQIKVKTDYKHSRAGASYSPSLASSKWKMPLALSLAAFAIVWRLGNWFLPVQSQELEQEEAWVEETEGQVMLNVALPEPVIEAAPELPSAEQIVEDEEQSLASTKQYTVKSGDNLGLYFQQSGIDSLELQELLATKDSAYLKRIYPGQSLKLQTNRQGKLQSLQLDVDPLTTLTIDRQDTGRLISKIQEKPIEKRVAFGGGKIYDSFFLAGKNAKLDDAMIMELANIFTYDIDFAQDIQPNDYFKVLFEEYFVNGVKVGNGPIVAAEFVNNGKHHQAIRFTDETGQASYYQPNGQGLKKAFIRTPVQFTRISSHFNLHRRHPILHKIRAHRGVDYAAPAGTPVKAVGKGKVVFVGTQGGYGNTIVLQHSPKYSTLYAHLSKFAKGLKPGQAVKQGQIIGNVGKTGLASGPHLHYEFRINGVHHNPLTVALPMSENISNKSKPKFLAYASDLLKQMDRQGKVMVASKDNDY